MVDCANESPVRDLGYLLVAKASVMIGPETEGRSYFTVGLWEPDADISQAH